MSKQIADLTNEGLTHTRAFIQSRIDAHLEYDLARDLQTVRDIDKEIAKRGSKIDCRTCTAECDAPDPCPR